jgi:hypothetical protein
MPCLPIEEIVGERSKTEIPRIPPGFCEIVYAEGLRKLRKWKTKRRKEPERELRN